MELKVFFMSSQHWLQSLSESINISLPKSSSSMLGSTPSQATHTFARVRHLRDWRSLLRHFFMGVVWTTHSSRWAQALVAWICDLVTFAALLNDMVVCVQTISNIQCVQPLFHIFKYEDLENMFGVDETLKFKPLDGFDYPTKHGKFFSSKI